MQLETRCTWLDRRFLGMGTGAGVLGGACCLGKAVAVGAGLGASSFLVSVMDEFQVYFVVGSAVLLVFWLLGYLRTYGLTPAGLRAASRSSLRHVAVCGGAYVVTLGATMAVMGLVDWLRAGS